MKILHISDTHGFHEQLKIPEDVDMIIHTGDATNWKDPYRNSNEMLDFIHWYQDVPCFNKIYICGNHDTSMERGLIKRSAFEAADIIYIENELVEIDGVKIWGSPYTPTFCDWAFMKSRNTINRVWETIPNNVDVIATHGPCKGILDLSYNHHNELEFCGDSALRKHVLEIQPKLFLSGHIHNCQDILNVGTRTVEGYRTIFSNAACVTDGRFDKGLTSHGNILEI